MSLSDYLLADLQKGRRAADAGGAARAAACAPGGGSAGARGAPVRAERDAARRRMIVVDASAAVELLLGTARGAAVAERIFDPAESLHAPELLDLEIAQVLRRYERARIIGRAPSPTRQAARRSR